jgi:malate dehydrogenase (quinone)
MQNANSKYADAVIIGGGIMSATLSVLLKELEPSWCIHVYERLDAVAQESSDAWNNAGTGHSAFCELNYTPQKADGSVDISKAIKICEQFMLSRELWAYLVKSGAITKQFVQQVPHCSFVEGEKDVEFLQQRFELLKAHHLFNHLQWSTDTTQLQAWFPLVMAGRDDAQTVAATFTPHGTDVNFGELTKQLMQYMNTQPETEVHVAHHVHDIDPLPDGTWQVEVKNVTTSQTHVVHTPFVFVGAGGGALKLLNKAEIPEVDGYGGFPVGGKWLRCTNEAVIADHNAKVYGKAKLGAPPMSVPHLDSRLIDGKRELLFGPYAGFSTKFLKHGSYWDLIGSMDIDNILPMLDAGFHNMPLTKYLIDQVRMSFDEKFEALLEYYPTARKEDWELIEAGQRVQIIKKNKDGEGVIEFGTEIICNAQGSIAGLLGASPGASTAVAIMLDVLRKCFSVRLCSQEWQSKLDMLMPSWNKKLHEDVVAAEASNKMTREVLGV